MSDPAHQAQQIVAAAVIDALIAARWKCAEILSRRSCPVTADLLRGHATELATSPFARDQILKRALDAAVLDLENGRTPLDEGATFFFGSGPPSGQDRNEVAKLVSQLAPAPIDTSDRLVAEFERRQSAEYLSDGQLSVRLAEEAKLQEATWNDPRVTAEPEVRLMMLRSIPRFAERAAELDRCSTLEKTRAERRDGGFKNNEFLGGTGLFPVFEMGTSPLPWFARFMAAVPRQVERMGTLGPTSPHQQGDRHDVAFGRGWNEAPPSDCLQRNAPLPVRSKTGDFGRPEVMDERIVR